MKKIFVLILLFLIPISNKLLAQDWALKTNTLSAVYGTLNLGVEYSLGMKSSIDLSYSVRPWERKENHVNKYWLIQSEYRYWTCQKFNGHFFGAYVNGAQYNVGGKKMPFGLFPSIKKYRYEGWMTGVGISYGYHFMINKNWNIGASLGVGYELIRYDKFRSPQVCAERIESGYYHYFGPTRTLIEIAYIF